MLAVAWLPWIRLPDAWAEVPSESAKAEIINKTAVLRFTIILLGCQRPDGRLPIIRRSSERKVGAADPQSIVA
jgi:hypothetical protein